MSKIMKPARTQDWDPKQEIEVEEAIDNAAFKKPMIGKELKVQTFYKDGFTEKELEAKCKKLIDMYQKRGYTRITDQDDAITIFGGMTDSQGYDFTTGRALYFVWAFSGYLDLIVEQAEKDDYIQSFSKHSHSIISDQVAELDLISNTYLLDEFRFMQRTDRYGRLHKRAGNGDFLYAKPSGKAGGNSRPVRRTATIFDLPLALIKKIAEQEGIKPAPKKSAK